MKTYLPARYHISKNLFDGTSSYWNGAGQIVGRTFNEHNECWSTKILASKGDTFTIKKHSDTIGMKRTHIGEFDSNNICLSTTDYTSITNGVTYTPTQDNCVSVHIEWSKSTSADVDDIMLNEGSTALPYEPYGNTVKNYLLSKATLNPEWRGLPSGYQQVEYVESTETNKNWIELPYNYNNQTDEIYIKIQAPTSNRDTAFFGRYEDPGIELGHLYANQTPEWRFDVHVRILNDGEIHEFKNISGTWYMDGQAVKPSTVSVQGHLYLFGRYYGSVDKAGLCKIYSFQQKRNDELVCDFVPCLNTTTNKYGMYDLVTSTFYGNNGTGDFTGGTIVPKYSSIKTYFLTKPRINPEWRGLPSGYQQVEYTESSGTQYIDTLLSNLKPSQVKYTFKASTTNRGATTGFCGARNALNNGALNIFSVSTDGLRFDLCNQSTNATAQNLSDYHTFKVKYKQYQIDDNTPVNYVTDRDAECSYSILLFSMNNGGSIYAGASCKICYFKIDVDETLARDFVPCLNTTTNKYGMYDLVTNQFFGNDGTGDFMGGPIVPKYLF